MSRKHRARSDYSFNYSVPTVRVSQPVIAKRSLDVGPRTIRALEQLEQLRNSFLRDIEDRRRYHPEGVYRSPRDRLSRVSKISRMSLLSSHQSFAEPLLASGAVPSAPAARSSPEPRGGAIVCVRRKVRREVLFAKGRAGGRVKRARRRNVNSQVFC